MKRLLQNLTLVAVSLALPLGTIEIGLRVVSPPEPPQEAPSLPSEFMACRHDPLLGWVFPPDTSGTFLAGTRRVIVRTNSLGIRSPEIPPPDSPGLTILVLGDSYAFGYGVADSVAFPRRLEALLRRSHMGRRIDVINAAIPRFGLYQQRRMLASVQSRTRVDVVISTYSLANDPVDELRIARVAPDRLAEYGGGLHDPRSLWARILRGSRLLSWADSRSQGIQFVLANVSPPALRLARRSLGDLCDAATSAGLPILLVVVPRRGEIASGHGLVGWLDGVLMRRARRLPPEVASTRGIPMLDVTETLRSVEKREPAFFAEDPHWTPAGHEAVAAAVARALPQIWLEKRRSER